MLNLDPETQCITCPQGDTGLLLASITALDGQPLAQPLDGVAVFAVCQQIGGVFPPSRPSRWSWWTIPPPS